MQLAEQEHVLAQLREGATEWSQPAVVELGELLTEMRAASAQMSADHLAALGSGRRDSAPEKLELGGGRSRRARDRAE